MLNLVLFGPPGAGKGTQSQKIIDKYNLIHLSTGDLFRKHLKEGSELGKLAQKYMDEGLLVPDDVVIGMVDEKMKEVEFCAGYIFDGFPRTVNQAEALDQLLDKKGCPINGMIALDVPEDELEKRILERGKTSEREDDQNIEKIRKRISVYKSETLPVAEYYQGQNKFAQINGVGSVGEIFEKITKVVESF